jgi:hypothetical protein
VDWFTQAYYPDRNANVQRNHPRSHYSQLLDSHPRGTCVRVYRCVCVCMCVCVCVCERERVVYSDIPAGALVLWSVNAYACKITLAGADAEGSDIVSTFNMLCKVCPWLRICWHESFTLSAARSVTLTPNPQSFTAPPSPLNPKPYTLHPEPHLVPLTPQTQESEKYIQLVHNHNCETWPETSVFLGVSP